MPRQAGSMKTGLRRARRLLLIRPGAAWLWLVPGLCLASPAASQMPLPLAPALPEARPADVKSPEALIEAFYETLSAPAGQPRDLDRLRSLFVPEGRLLQSFLPRGEKVPRLLVWNVEGWIRRILPRHLASGFHEREVHRVTERFGHILHAFSTYESRHRPDGPVVGRGVNSFQLFWDGARWWIVHVYWDYEAPDRPLPERYLPAGENGRS